MSDHGLLVVLTGPSGVGKGTVRSRVLDRVDDARLSVSVTTRPPRPAEVDGVDYHFVDRGRFEELVEDEAFLEWAEYAGHLYGTPRTWVEEQIADGAVVVLEIEVQGALQVRSATDEALLVFLAPPDMAELRRRLVGRGTEDPAVIERRMAVAHDELAHRDEFDVVVVNDDLERCVDELVERIDDARSA